jgi:hypothetical protein
LDLNNDVCREARRLLQLFLVYGQMSSSDCRLFQQPSAVRLLRAIGAIRPDTPSAEYYVFSFSLLRDVLAGWFYNNIPAAPLITPYPSTLPELIKFALPLLSRRSLFHDEAANRHSFSEYQAQGEIHIAIRTLLGCNKVILRESKVVSNSEKKLDLNILNGRRDYIEVCMLQI